MAQSKDMASHANTTETNEGLADGTAIAEQPKTSPFMMCFSLLIALTGLIYNFDLGYGGIVLIMEPFRRDFGTCVTKPDASRILTETCTLTALQQSLVSVTFLFVALGSIIAGFAGHYFGRRGTIQIGCVLVAVGAGGMLGTTGSFTAYMVCKCIGGIGLGCFNAAAPAYGVECTTSSKRGMLTSLFGFGLGLGSTVAAAVCLGTSKYTSSLAWQTPIICQIPLALGLGVGVMIFPESPRWLLTKGRETEARKAFARLYAVDLSSAVVSRQVHELQLYIELEKNISTTTSWTEIFHRTNIRRTLISWLVSIGQAICGGKFVSVYASLFLAGVGIANPYLITLVVVSCAVAGGVILPFVTEYGGRRFAVVVGYGLAASFMLIIGTVATGLGSQSAATKNVLIVFCAYGLQYIVASLAAAVYEIFAFAAAFYTPYMLSKDYGNMGNNVAYFYFGINAALLILVFVFVPETARLTLEQIDDYFLSGPKAWKTSTARNKKIQREQGPSGISAIDKRSEVQAAEHLEISSLGSK